MNGTTMQTLLETFGEEERLIQQQIDRLVWDIEAFETSLTTKMREDLFAALSKLYGDLVTVQAKRTHLLYIQSYEKKP